MRGKLGISDTPKRLASALSQRKWRAEHREAANTKSRAWYAANRAVHRERTSNWKRANALENKNLNAEWYLHNRAKAITKSAKWAKQNRLLLNTRKQLRTLTKQEKEAGRKKPKRCDVCKRGNIAIHFDHCHKKGHFRGWLCYGCNAALGYARDLPSLLRKLADYIERDKEIQKGTHGKT